MIAKASAREERNACIEAEDRRCLVAVVIAVVRSSELDAALDVLFKGASSDLARRVCAYDSVASTKYISYSRLFSITRSCSLPGMLEELIVGRHEKRGLVLSTTSMLSFPPSPSSRAKR